MTSTPKGDRRPSIIFRMDDPESEGEIQEHESAGGKNGYGKLSWMVRFGKKVLVTGLVISSAPLVLPPLVAVSAIGLACSVPYGIFLVSYACTETVMSRLLPMPSPTAPLLLEYRRRLDGEEAGRDKKQGEQNDVIIGGIVMEREEEEFKGDVVEEIGMRFELVDKEKEDFDGGSILQEDAYQKGGAVTDEKKSVDEVAEIVEEKRYEEKNGEFLDEEEGRASQSFEVEVKEISESKVEQPIVEERRGEEPVGQGHGFEDVIGGDKKQSSNIEKEMPLEVEYVEENKELLRGNRDENKSDYARDDNQSIGNRNAERQPTKKTHELKKEGTTKGKGKEKERGNVDKETTAEATHAAFQRVQATDTVNDELVRQSRGSLQRKRDDSKNHDAGEDKQGVEKSQVGLEGQLPKGNEGRTDRKPEELHLEESAGEEPVHEVTVVLGGLEGSEKNDSNMEETPAVQLVQAIDVEENEKIVIGARGLSERIRDESKTDSEVDDKRRAERVNIVGEIEVKIEGTTEGEVEQCLGDEMLSEQPIEEIGNIVVEFDGDEKNGGDKEETPFQIKNVAVQLSKSTGIEEDEELVRETRGLLEKIRDEGKTDYPADDKPSTENQHLGAVKDAKRTVGGVGKAKKRRRRKQTREFEPKVDESKADSKVQMKESAENLDAASKEMKLDKGIKGSTEKMDDNENGVEQNYLLNKEKKDAIFSNEDDREINNQQELDLLEDLSTVSLQGSHSEVSTLEESLPSSSYSVHQEMSDCPELPLSTKAQEWDDTQTYAENAIDAASNEALYSEEKIWEQINAMRTIVGYKAARQDTAIEELKALYLFTGIEPPPSFKDTSDLPEVNARLRFLMSVVGVKFSP